MVSAVLEGVLSKDTVKKKEATLLKAKADIGERLRIDNQMLKSLPSPEKVNRQAEHLRLGLQDYFGSEERMLAMTYEEKSELLHRIFYGKDQYGMPYGVYLTKLGKNKWDYFIYASMFAGTRTVKGDDIDYRSPGNDDDNESGDSGNDNGKSGKRQGGNGSAHNYKTNCLANDKKDGLCVDSFSE